MRSRSAPATTASRSPSLSRDEFGDLTVAFNDMSRNLAIKEDLLNEQRRENDRLLLSLMPEPVVQRYREGEETIAQDHQDVTVIFADIVGLDELSAELTSERVAGDRQQAGPPVRRRRRESRRRAGAHAAQRLPGQLRTERAAHRQRPSHRRLRDRDAAHHRPVQRRDGPRPATARRHRHRHGSAAGWSADPAWPTTCGGRRSISPTRCRADRRSPAST